MKNILILMLSFLLPNMGSADGFYCLPSLKQTGFVIDKKDGFIQLKIENPMGYDFMPQYDGPTSASSLAMQKMQFDDLKDLGSGFVLKWADSKCTTDFINKTINCDGATENKIKNIQSFYLATTVIDEKTRSDQYKKFRYRINIDKSGTQYFISIEFYEQNCKSF